MGKRQEKQEVWDSQRAGWLTLAGEHKGYEVADGVCGVVNSPLCSGVSYSSLAFYGRSNMHCRLHLV